MTKSSTVYGMRFEDGAWVPVQQQQKCDCASKIQELEKRIADADATRSSQFQRLTNQIARLNDRLNGVHGAR